MENNISCTRIPKISRRGDFNLSVNFKFTQIRRDREGQHVLVEGTVYQLRELSQQGTVMPVNIYAPVLEHLSTYTTTAKHKRSSKHINTSTVIADDLCAPLGKEIDQLNKESIKSVRVEPCSWTQGHDS